ncbi:MAG: PEP-CTERM sorting domain-containing protein [Kiritimatiellia bacterium]
MKLILPLFAAALPLQAGLIYYDAQQADSAYVNTSYNASGMTYTMANSSALAVSGGRRVVNGGGDGVNQNDYFSLPLSTGDNWDSAGLLDAGTGTIGGGNVSGSLYTSFLLRAQNPANSTTEGSGAYAAFQLGKGSGSGASAAIGMGNHWNAWAYSIFGNTGDHDLVQGTGGTTWLNYDTNVHWMVARITFNAGAADDYTIWLDPNPDDLDSQAGAIRRFSGTADMAFNQVSYRAGNIQGTNAWEFDEVRFGTTWADMQSVTVVPEPASAGLLALGLAAALGRKRRT